MTNKHMITVVGMGYVGLSMATLLSQRHCVHAVDILPEKIQQINQRICPISDSMIEQYFAARSLDLTATTDAASAYAVSEFVIVATPTNYDTATNAFDTRPVESVVKAVSEINPGAVVVIKSTVPVGFTAALQNRYPNMTLLFAPEFLRETKALYDNLHPSRIIVGTVSQQPHHLRAARAFAALLQEASLDPDVPVLFMEQTEAETVKLFSNAYLAMRISFFNELDTYAETKNLDTGRILSGVCLDPRIGTHYNNPSFGYGGYCLPKDTRQLLANYHGIPEQLIGAVVESNRIRMEYVANRVLELSENMTGPVGIFRLTMKSGSDNFRQSSIQSVMQHLLDHGRSLVIYEPVLSPSEQFMGCPVEPDLQKFKQMCSLILANRYDSALDDVRQKVYTRDLFGRD